MVQSFIAFVVLAQIQESSKRIKASREYNIKNFFLKSDRKIYTVCPFVKMCLLSCKGVMKKKTEKMSIKDVYSNDNNNLR